jgi:hypothetical protein
VRDLFNHINPKPVIQPVVVADNTAQVGAIIDRQGHESVTYIIETGTLADADATFAVRLDEGNASNLSDSSQVADIDTLGTQTGESFTFAADGACFKLAYIGNKRYTRLTVTPANNTGNAPMSAICILAHGALQAEAAIPT